MSDSQKKIVNARQINKMRWIVGLAMSLVVIAITVVSLSCHPFIDSEKPSGMGTNSPAMYDLAQANFCSNDHFMKNTLQP